MMPAVINRPGGHRHMVSKKMKGMLVATAAGAMISLGAMAQAPGGGPPGGGMGGGMRMGAQDRPTTEQRMGLTDPALKLTADQQGKIDKLVDAYLEDQKKIAEKYPMTQGTPPSQEAMTARQTARTNLTGAIDKVLNDDQRKIFDAAQQRRGPGGGPGGPGGGAGGPPPGH
jgi:Spy/CpxP family protein refolding chaperone